MPVTNEDRLAAAHATLTSRLSALTTGQDWQRFLALARHLGSYSIRNRLLLAGQIAERGYGVGPVAPYRRWPTIPAVDGGHCQVRRGETALRIFAPLHATIREVDEDSGEEATRPGPVRRFRLVPVFHVDQLVAAPDLPEPPTPQLLTGDAPAVVWDAIVAHFAAAGYTVSLVDTVPGIPAANGQTDFAGRSAVVRSDLAPAARIKTGLHELAHLLLHDPGAVDDRLRSRELVEVEAETVAFLCMAAVGIDSAAYSIPYLASWGADPDALADTAQRAMAAADDIIERLAGRLELGLDPDPLAPTDALAEVHSLALSAHRATVRVFGDAHPDDGGVPASDDAAVAATIEPDDPPVALRDAVVDDLVDDHLAAGGGRDGLVAVIGDHLFAGDAAALATTTDPNRIVELLAAAGVSAPYSARVLARMGCDLETVATALRGEESPPSRREIYLAEDRHAALQVIGANGSDASALGGLTNGPAVEPGGGAGPWRADRPDGTPVLQRVDDTDVARWAAIAAVLADRLDAVDAARAVLAAANSCPARATALTVLAADTGDLAALIGRLGDEVDGGTVAAATELVGWSPAAAATALAGANADPDVVAAAITVRCGNDRETVDRVLAAAWAGHPGLMLSPPSQGGRRGLRVVDGPAPTAVSAADVGVGDGEPRPTPLSRGLALIDRWWAETSPSPAPPPALPGDGVPSMVPGR